MQKFLAFLVILGVVGLSPGAFAQQESDLSRKVGELADKLAFASEGQILSVKENSVYVDLGQKDGVVEGNRFEVARLGDPLMVGDKILGYEETIIGEIEVFRVRKNFLIATITRQETEIQSGDKVYQLKKKIRRVAVTEFLYGNQLNDFTRNLQDLLYTNLIQKGMSVVEREKLEQVLREQKIAYSGIIDLETAAQVGKILGVEGILVGSVADQGTLVAITARLVDVEKGAAITAARVELPKTANIVDLLGRGSRIIIAPEMAFKKLGKKAATESKMSSKDMRTSKPTIKYTKHNKGTIILSEKENNVYKWQGGSPYMTTKLPKYEGKIAFIPMGKNYFEKDLGIIGYEDNEVGYIGFKLYLLRREARLLFSVKINNSWNNTWVFDSRKYYFGPRKGETLNIPIKKWVDVKIDLINDLGGKIRQKIQGLAFSGSDGNLIYDYVVLLPSE